jgi:hypothetical protein
MTTTIHNLASLRQFFNAERILICFNGPISRNLIGEIGQALRSHIEGSRGDGSTAMDVFSVYIEMSQNIRHYAGTVGYGDAEASATVVIATTPDQRFAVSAGNLVELADGHALVERVQALASLDKAGLKALYKQQLRQPREPQRSTGAGLGLIEIARRASEPLEVSLEPQADGGRGFLILRAII